MQRYLTATDIANSISMMRSVDRGTTLVVEGVTDSRLYSKFIAKERVRITIAHSKENVKDVIRETVRRRGMKDVAGIVDSDLDLLSGNDYGPPLFKTDTRDMESMIIASDSFDEVMFEYADPGKLEEFEKHHGNLRDRIEDAVYPLGMLMYVSHSENLNLCFKDLDFDRFIDAHSLKCDNLAMCKAVLYNTAECPLGTRDLLELLDDYLGKNPYVEDVVRGHDLVRVLTIALRMSVGGTNATSIRDAHVGSALRLSYDIREFSKTRLFKESDEWAERSGIPLWSRV